MMDCSQDDKDQPRKPSFLGDMETNLPYLTFDNWSYGSVLGCLEKLFLINSNFFFLEKSLNASVVALFLNVAGTEDWYGS